MTAPRAASAPLLIGAFVTAFVAASAPAGDESPRYDGKYAKTAEVTKALARIPALRKDALANVAEKLGLAPKDADAIVIEFQDARPADAEKLARFDAPLFQTVEDARGPVRIRVYAEGVAAGSADFDATVRHEMVHAVMRELVATKETYSAIPKWLREGLALHAAGQTDERVSAILHSGDAARTLEVVFPGLEEGEHDLDRYAEDALAVAFLAERRGDKAVKELAARLVAAEAPHAAVEAASGTPWETFRKEARAYSLDVARRAMRPEWDAYLALREKDRAKDYAGVIDAAVAFEKANPKSPILADALYWRGKAERIVKKPEAARKTLARIVDGMRRESHYLDEAWYQLGAAHVATSDWKSAASAFETLLRDHPGTTLSDRALVRLAECSLRRGDRDAARKRLDLFDRSFEKSAVAKDAAALRKELEEK
jgi:TolA-binding protein